MTQPHHERAHARLGASSAYRWINCPGSLAATDGLDSDSVYAAEGTAAHTLAERVFNAPGTVAVDFLGVEIRVGNHVFEVDEEMAEAVQLYVDTIEEDSEAEDQAYVERRFNLEAVRQGMFGTNDYLRYRPSTKRLTVYDYKHGIRTVLPDDNPQLLYYALGAAMNLGLSVIDVELVIVQPRAFGPSVRRWVTDLLTLLDFANVLGEAADAALAVNAPLIAGPWCRESFCPAAGTCEVYRAFAREAARLEFAQAPTATISDEDLAAILDEADAIRDWIAAVFAEATRRADAGNIPPGYKMVPKRALRKWIGEPEVVAAALAARFKLKADQLYVEPKLKSPAQMELMLPKTVRSELGEFYVKFSSGSVLARDSDTRDAVHRTTAAEDFTT